MSVVRLIVMSVVLIVWAGQVISQGNSTDAGSVANGQSQSVARKRVSKLANSQRRVRSKVARSCSGEVGSVLLEEWYRHCQLVFTGTVENIDRPAGALNVTLRRIIRSQVDVVSRWRAFSSASSVKTTDNSLTPLSVDSLEAKPTLMLYDLFEARQNSCVPQFRIRVKDVLIFLVHANQRNETLHLVSAPLRITLRNLRLIHSSPGKVDYKSLPSSQLQMTRSLL